MSDANYDDRITELADSHAQLSAAHAATERGLASLADQVMSLARTVERGFDEFRRAQKFPTGAVIGIGGLVLSAVGMVGAAIIAPILAVALWACLNVIDHQRVGAHPVMAKHADLMQAHIDNNDAKLSELRVEMSEMEKRYTEALHNNDDLKDSRARHDERLKVLERETFEQFHKED